VIRRDSLTVLRDLTRWRIAVAMCVAGIAMVLVLGVLNGLSGRADSVWLSVGVGSSLLACLGMLLKLPKELGGRIYFWFTVAILAALPYFGYLHGRTFHYWAYVLPPVLFFLMRPRPALVGMLVLGRELDAETPLCRYGGEEFAIVIPGAGLDAAVRLAERLRAAVEAADFGEAKVTLSAGAATWRPGTRTIAAALDAADAALYAAKRRGRNRVESEGSGAAEALAERRRHHLHDA
jgi:hypothetical protein